MVHKRKYGLLLPLIIILFVCAAAATMEEEKALKTIEVHVEVRNNLPPGNKFTIHCKSKNDDLGVNTMAPNQVYAFHFHVSIWETLFYCRVNTNYGQGVYDFYKYSRDFKRCRLCTYSVTEAGVYAYSDGSNVSDFFLKWA